MNKTDLVNVIAANAELNKKQAEAALNATLAAVAEALKNGDKVQLSSFGIFAVKDVAERTCRNPRTNETITVPATKKVTFSAGKALKDQVNG